MSVTDTVLEPLADALVASARRAGIDCTGIFGLRRLSGGASKESWAFDCERGDGDPIRLVLRRAPPSARFSSAGMVSMDTEAEILERTLDHGVPVPALAFRLDPACHAGSGYAMARIDGETVGVRILKDARLANAREGMAFACGKILAAIHTVPADSIGGLMTETPAEALAAIEARYHAIGQARPIFDLAFRWLAGRLPTPARLALIHGDFRNGNLVVGEEGIRAVLDWEAAHVGDPIEDLAWLCIGSWRFQRPDLPVGGFGHQDDLIAGYAAGGGDPVSLDALRWWETYGSLRWGVICAEVGARFADGVRTVEGGLIARRASEAEYDIMQLIDPRGER